MERERQRLEEEDMEQKEDDWGRERQKVGRREVIGGERGENLE